MRTFLACLLLWSFLPLAIAGRMLPHDVRKGTLTGLAFPVVQIDSESFRLAPGVQVRNQANMMVFPHSLNQQARIFYQLDMRGEVVKIWIMTPEEAETATAATAQ